MITRRKAGIAGGPQLAALLVVGACACRPGAVPRGAEATPPRMPPADVIEALTAAVAPCGQGTGGVSGAFLSVEVKSSGAIHVASALPGPFLMRGAPRTGTSVGRRERDRMERCVASTLTDVRLPTGPAQRWSGQVLVMVCDMAAFAAWSVQHPPDEQRHFDPDDARCDALGEFLYHLSHEHGMWKDCSRDAAATWSRRVAEVEQSAAIACCREHRRSELESYLGRLNGDGRLAIRKACGDDWKLTWGPAQ